MDKYKIIEQIRQTIAEIGSGNIYSEWENRDPDFLLNLATAKIDASVIRKLATDLVRADLEIELVALTNDNPNIVEYLIDLEARHIKGILVTQAK